MAELRPIPLQAFAESRGVPASAVVSRIRRGIYDGAQIDGSWVVLRGGGPLHRETEAERAASLRTWRRRLSAAGWIVVTVLGTLLWNGGAGASEPADVPEPAFLSPSARCDIAPLSDG